MTTARKPRTDLRVVAKTAAGPDLGALQAFVEDAARATVPAITRESVAVESMSAAVRVAEAEKTALRENRDLARRLFDALNASFDAAEADLDKAIARYRQGLGDGVGQ